MAGRSRAWFIRAAWGAAILGIEALLAWQYIKGKGDGKSVAGGNGRIEATQIDVAAKMAGRIKAILVNEGDFVTAGQLLAQMDTEVLRHSFVRPKHKSGKRKAR
jgi:HlyD family secretion protein